MVKWIAFALKDIFDIALVGGIFLAFFIKTKYPSATKSLGLGLFSSAFFSLLIKKDIIRFANDRQLQEGLIDMAALLCAAILIAVAVVWFYKGRVLQEQGKLTLLLSGFLGLIFAAALLPRTLGFVKLSERLIFQASMFNSDILIQSFGLALGVLLGVLILWSIVKGSERVSSKSIMLLAFLAVIPGQAINAINALRVLTLNRYIVLDSAGMGYLLDLINSQQQINIAIYIMPLLILPLALLAKIPVAFEPDNPAMIRKQKAFDRRQLRWTYMLFSCLILSYSVFMADSVLVTKSENIISAAIKVRASDGLVKVDKSKLMDGDLHRFSYQAGDRVVRFLLLHKGSGVFGVALDACQICGTVEFFKKEDNIICSACDSAINKTTFGFQGGCNPLPLEHKVDKKSIIISEKDLKEAAKHFDSKGPQ